MRAVMQALPDDDAANREIPALLHCGSRVASEERPGNSSIATRKDTYR